MDNLPQYGEWHLSNPVFSSNPPFAILRVDFRTNSGTVEYWHQTRQLTKTARLAPNKFGAMYEIGKDKGLFEAVYNDDQTLTIKFIGTVSTECAARPISLIGGERPVGQWSTGEKLNESIKRSLPLLPADARDEVAGMLNPVSLAIMATVTVMWGVSHFFGVGEIVDVILLITGGLMLGAAAIEVSGHLTDFVRKSTGAQTDADLDAAAEHFGQAVAKGGVQVVMTILLWKGAKAAPRGVKPPAQRGQLPTELNGVLRSRIPMAARAAVQAAEQGQQPRLTGVQEELAQLVRGVLNRIRRTDLKEQTDCWGACQELKDLAKAGNADESNAWSPISKFDHTMWIIGNEVVDTRPGMWRDHFKKFPDIRAAIEKAVPGLAKRLEEGAVLTIEEFNRFLGRTGTPRSPMFGDVPVRPRPESTR